MIRYTLYTDNCQKKYPPTEGPPLIIRIGLVLLTILILLVSQELWSRYVASKSRAEELEKLKTFIDNSEKGQKGFGYRLQEENIEGHTFLDQVIYPSDFASFSPKQKRAFIEAFYRFSRTKPPPEPKYFH